MSQSVLYVLLQAEPAADAEADAFFLDEESSAAAATSSQPAALLTEATPSISNATAKIETGAAEVMTVSQHKPASPPLRLQQQQQRKRKQEPDVSEHNKVHVKAVTGIQPISTAEHHAALNADLLSTDRPGPSRAKPAQKHRASAGADAGRLSAAPVLPCKMPSQHKQRGQTMHVVNDAHKARSVHVQDQRGETQVSHMT